MSSGNPVPAPDSGKAASHKPPSASVPSRTAALPVTVASDAIEVRGARVHNLKNLDFRIPHNAITVVTGVSGSGKSSLAFDTVYAEGQRRYVESMSAYARQFLERIEKPDVDEITGISPAIAIKQKNSTRNPRSTVATTTEIYDYLRLLYARAGRTFCTRCGDEVRKDSMDEIAARVLARDDLRGRRFFVLFPLHIPEPPLAAGRKPRARKPAKPDPMALRNALLDLQKRGFNRLWQDARVYEFSTPESLLEVDFAKPVFVLADRLVAAPGVRARLIDSVETCYREGRGEAILQFLAADGVTSATTTPAPSGPKADLSAEASAKANRLVFTERFECKRCGAQYQPPEPQLFSFNSPQGACPRCQGFGNTIDFDLDLVVPDKAKSLNQGAIEPWTKPRYRQLVLAMKKYARAAGIPLDAPWHQLTAKQRDGILHGDPAEDFTGVKGFFDWLERKKYKLHVRVFLSRYRGYAICPNCRGARLRAEARAVTIQGRPITDVCAMTVTVARAFFAALDLGPQRAAIAAPILTEIRQRLRYLEEVGLDYLTLDRLTSTLSGGEAQRIQLATCLGSNLAGALYVLDEPSIGLHPRDTARLIAILKSLRDLGNTILIVEHDPDTILAADYLLDLGPGAGEHGGRIVFAGAREELITNGARGQQTASGSGPLKPANGAPVGAALRRPLPPLANAGNSAIESLTARYLAGDLRIPVPALRSRPNGKFLKLSGARVHNLQNVDVMIPLDILVAITGVSGSGKSTLLYDVLYKAIQARKNRGDISAICDRVEGDQHIAGAVLVDQSPIGRTPRSNPATYMKAFDAIREALAATLEAEKRGYSAGHFSFNIPGGRCETCQGDGTVTVEMQFLADVELTCEDCRGTRFKSGVLEVTYRGRNVYQILQLTVREALVFFAGAPKVASRLKILDEIGLGYLRLGQSATTLSGGEAQRLKLAAHLNRQRSGDGPEQEEDPRGMLYIFDEPTTGLHFDDIQKLLAAFRKLQEGGASLLVIEHNLDVIKSADWVIDLGPEGGARGGRVIAAGTPEQVARNAHSHTGKFLARALNSSGSAANHR